MAHNYGGNASRSIDRVASALLHRYGRLGQSFRFGKPSLPGRRTMRGIVFASGAWLLMMVIIMPMAGAGIFAAKMGMAAPVMTLVLHVIYGAVLGAVYGKLATRVTATPASAGN